MKQCSKCKKLKPFSEYYKRKNRKSGYQPACKKCEIQRTKKWIKENKESVKQREKTRYYANKNILNEQSRIYHAENREAINQKRRQKHIENLEHEKEVSRLWKKNNPELVRNQSARRRANKKNNGEYKLTKKELTKLYSSNCFYCGKNKSIEIDHVIPLSRGGTHSIGNLVSACRNCNARKNNKTIMEWRKLER